MDIKKVREDFPLTRECIYLANCAEGPLAIPVADAIVRQGVEPRVSKHKENLDMGGGVEAGRQEAATLLGAAPEEIAFARGTTEAVNIVSTMIDWKPGDNVIVNNLEFPSNVFPWQRQERFGGVEVKMVPHRDGEILVEDIIAKMDEKTRLVAVSHVQMANGYKVDIAALGKETRKRGILLAVDAVQSMGGMSVKVKELGVDFLVAGAHKYLLGPSGMGVLYVRGDLVTKFQPMYVGPWQQEEIFDFTYHEYVLTDTARRFEFGGHPNALGMPGLTATLKYLNEVGVDKIEERRKMLQEALVSALHREGVPCPKWAEEPHKRGTFIGIEVKGSTTEFAEKLKERGVFCAPSRTLLGERLRIAPTFYNTKEEIDEGVRRIAELMRDGG